MKNQEIRENRPNWGVKAEILCNAYIGWQLTQSLRLRSERQTSSRWLGR